MIFKPFDSQFLDRCKKVTEEYEKLCGRWTSEAQLFHIITEVCEFSQVLRNKKEEYGTGLKYIDKQGDELADIFLTTVATANYFNYNNEFINKHLLLKLDTVEDRVRRMTA